MPAPFPGMDPYLEDPLPWESFHSRLIGVLDEMISARARSHFVVQQSSVTIVEPGGWLRRQPIKPDIYLTEAGRTPGVMLDVRPITTPTILKARYPDEIRQRFLEIRDRKSRAVVAIIEVVSPMNKSQAGDGYGKFDQKCRDVMASPVHWLEIDLLRAGDRPPEVAGQSDYYILLKRGHTTDAPATAAPLVLGEEEFEIWFRDLRDPLPVVAVPLRPPLPDVALDLQAALTTVYDRFYAGEVDYTALPPPPLAPADAAWAEDLIRAWTARGLAE